MAVDLHQAVEHLRSTLAIAAEQPVEYLTIPIWLFLSSRLYALHPAPFFFFSCHFQLYTSLHTVQAGGTLPKVVGSIQMYSFATRPFERALKQF